jgi:hypothetical protein
MLPLHIYCYFFLGNDKTFICHLFGVAVLATWLIRPDLRDKTKGRKSIMLFYSQNFPGAAKCLTDEWTA